MANLPDFVKKVVSSDGKVYYRDTRFNKNVSYETVFNEPRIIQELSVLNQVYYYDNAVKRYTSRKKYIRYIRRSDLYKGFRSYIRWGVYNATVQKDWVRVSSPKLLKYGGTANSFAVDNRKSLNYMCVKSHFKTKKVRNLFLSFDFAKVTLHYDVYTKIKDLDDHRGWIKGRTDMKSSVMLNSYNLNDLNILLKLMGFNKTNINKIMEKYRGFS